MTVADLFKQDVAALVENEGRRICSFVRCVPTQTVQVRHFVVRVDHELYVGRQIRLLCQKLLGMLIAIGWRGAGVYTRRTVDFSSLRSPALCSTKSMYLLDAVWALIAREASEQHKHERTLTGSFARLMESPVGVSSLKSGALAPTAGVRLGNSRRRLPGRRIASVRTFRRLRNSRPCFAAGIVDSGVHSVSALRFQDCHYVAPIEV